MGDIGQDQRHHSSADTPTGSGRRVAVYAVGLVGIAIVALLGLFVVGLTREGETTSSPLMNNPAPLATGVLADGTPFNLSHRKGSWVAINFFTPDCVPCILEQPQLIEFVEQQRSLGDQGAEFYTVVQHATPEEVDAFFAQYGGGDWPVVFDDEFEFQAGFGVAQVPETWLIDPNGIVRGRVVGELSDAAVFSAEIQKLKEQLGFSG